MWLIRKQNLMGMLLWALWQLCRGQCPDHEQVARQVAHIEKSDQLVQLTELDRLCAAWLTCRLPQDSIYTRLLLEQSISRLRQGYLKEAVLFGRRAVRIVNTYPKQVDQVTSAKAFARLGAMLAAENQINQANALFKKGISIADRSKEASYWGAYACVHLAYSLYNNGDYQKSLVIAQKGEVFAARVDDADLLARNLHEQARTLVEVKRWSEARLIMSRVLTLSRQFSVDPYELGMYYKLMAIVERELGRWSLAQSYFKRSLRIQKEAGLMEMYAYTANSIGFSYYQRQEYDQALWYFNKAMQASHSTNTKAQIVDNIGAVYWKQGHFEKALRFFQKGLGLMRVTIDTATYLINPEAKFIRSVSDREQLFTLIQDKADTWLDYAKTTNNNPEQLQHALETYQVADQMIDYMRWDHTAQESKLYWRQKTRGMYERAIETCYWLGDAEQAFRFFEKSRAVMLADKLNELGARQQLSETQAQQEKELREAVSAQQNKLATLTPDSARYKPANDSLVEKQDKLDTFLKRLEASNPTYYRYKYDTTTTKLADLQSHLAVRNASFVTYFIGDSALYVLGVTGDKATLLQQPIGGYNQTARQFMALLDDPVAMNRTANVAQFLKSGNGLYRQLLAPLNLLTGSVIISPDGSFIPFETLSRSAREPDYLVKNYAFSYAYSARLLLRNIGSASRVAGLGERDFLGVAPVTFAATLKQVSLPGSDEALKPISNRFKSASLFTGLEATRRTFVTAAADARVIHLFTHATADTTNSEPLLYFADSTLRLSDLGDGGLTHTQLAVLAACKTGVGANQRGEGVFSLARGLAALGVPSVLTTLWSVENKATYKITDLFYQYLDQGLPKDVALQRAKQDWLATAGGADQLPNAWAGLILIGDTEPLSRPVQWAWVAGGTLLLLGVAGGAWWWRRKRGREQTPNMARLA